MIDELGKEMAAADCEKAVMEVELKRQTELLAKTFKEGLGEEMIRTLENGVHPVRYKKSLWARLKMMAKRLMS